MKTKYSLTIVLILVIGVTAFQFDDYLGSRHTHQPITFAPGEQLKFRLHYGFITAGEAYMDIEPAIGSYEDKPVYKVNVLGKSTGAFDVFIRIRNTYRSYIDTSTLNPLMFYRNVEEGSYRRQESTYFDREKKIAKVEIRDPGKLVETKIYEVKPNVQDLISGYFFLRNVDFNSISPGTVVGVDAFFEDKSYDFKVRYLGKETIRTPVGKVRAIKMVPVMPDNQLFKGGESIKVWISDDQNRVPLKVKAEMLVGAVEVELISYKGLKHPFSARN
jgi:hypothetical protein